MQKPKEVEDEEKRERKDDEGAEEENAEELEMKDALFGDENMEPPGKAIFMNDVTAKSCEAVLNKAHSKKSFQNVLHDIRYPLFRMPRYGGFQI